MTVVGTYIDRALSAKTADRPEFQHMIKDSAKELFEVVIPSRRSGNRDFQKRLIDTFVNSVYVFDDKLVFTYNYQHGMQTILLEEIWSALDSDLRCGSPRRQEYAVPR